MHLKHELVCVCMCMCVCSCTCSYVVSKYLFSKQSKDIFGNSGHTVWFSVFQMLVKTLTLVLRLGDTIGFRFGLGQGAG